MGLNTIEAYAHNNDKDWHKAYYEEIARLNKTGISSSVIRRTNELSGAYVSN